ncbi:hypothetical protein MBLNU457_5732t2 [Dothideomycetes sp. NU457]
MPTNAGVPVQWPKYNALTAKLDAPVKPEKPQNPALRMLAVYYDRYQKKRVQQKWCDLVRPISEETLAPNTMRRKITIYIEAPPGDGMRSAREHFYEYVKPILVAGAMDWDVVEGRREGDIRYGTAERIRRKRRTVEGAVVPNEDDEESQKQLVVEQSRTAAGIVKESGAGGDLLIGRHTWKEYIRGLHEGWLGPLELPAEAQSSPLETTPTTSEPKNTADGYAHSSIGDATVDAAKNIVAGQPIVSASVAGEATATPTGELTSDKDASPQEPSSIEATKEEEKPKPKNQKPGPYISTSAYSTSNAPSGMPSTFDPATVVPFPHILGFLNTPVRTYRYLTRRHLADDIGRRVAGLVIAAQSRSFNSSVVDEDGHYTNEQATLLESEEGEWAKSVRKKERAEGEESVWLDKIVMDERISERMRLWELRAVDEREAERLRQEPRGETKDE